METLGMLEQALANIYPLWVPIALGTIALGIAVLVTARIKSAVIWCRQFSVLFATASLSA